MYDIFTRCFKSEADEFLTTKAYMLRSKCVWASLYPSRRFLNTVNHYHHLANMDFSC